MYIYIYIYIHRYRYMSVVPKHHDHYDNTFGSRAVLGKYLTHNSPSNILWILIDTKVIFISIIAPDDTFLEEP